MTEILTISSIITPLVVGVTELVKGQIGRSKLLPISNVVTGILLSGLYSFSFVPQDLILYLWAGAIAGLAAGGLFELGDHVMKLQESNKSN